MYDVLIIGSGPAGLSAAIYSRRANINVAVIEKEYMGTGQIAESERVDNYPGLPGVSGYDLGEKFREHAAGLGTEFIENEVVDIVYEDNAQTYILKLTDESEISARAVIYAAGAYKRQAGVPGEKEYNGRGVSYCALCDGAFYKGKKVAVLGGGDTAFHDALYLSDICEKVYLVHRRKEFRAADSLVEALKSKRNVEFILEDSVKEILGDKAVNKVKLVSGNEIEVNGVFVAYGAIPQTGLLKHLVKTDDRGYVVSDETGITFRISDDKQMPGLYVAGGAREKVIQQVVTAVADGANAATSASEYIRNSLI